MGEIIGNQKVACQGCAFRNRMRACYRRNRPTKIGLQRWGRSMRGRAGLAVGAWMFWLAAAGVVHAQSQVIGAPPEAANMKLVGYNDLQARSAYQPTIHHQGDRFIAYVGHHGGTDDVAAPLNPLTGKAEPNGTSVVDVTD